MDIRYRMVGTGGSGVGALTVAGLAAAAAVHGAWASGVTWPRRSRDELADLVVGQRPFPSAAACWAVTGTLTAATWAVAAQAGLPLAAATRAPALARLGSALVAAGLLARGGAGVVVSAAGLAATTEEFRRADLRWYSPLCLALGTGAAVVAGRSR